MDSNGHLKFSRSTIGVLFDILFNLHKFMRFETRDPFQEKIRREDSFQTDWDRYAHMEYTRLSQEEEDGTGYTVSQTLNFDRDIFLILSCLCLYVCMYVCMNRSPLWM